MGAGDPRPVGVLIHSVEKEWGRSTLPGRTQMFWRLLSTVVTIWDWEEGAETVPQIWGVRTSPKSVPYNLVTCHSFLRHLFTRPNRGTDCDQPRCRWDWFLSYETPTEEKDFRHTGLRWQGWTHQLTCPHTPIQLSGWLSGAGTNGPRLWWGQTPVTLWNEPLRIPYTPDEGPLISQTNNPTLPPLSSPLKIGIVLHFPLH